MAPHVHQIWENFHSKKFKSCLHYSNRIKSIRFNTLDRPPIAKVRTKLNTGMLVNDSCDERNHNYSSELKFPIEVSNVFSRCGITKHD